MNFELYEKSVRLCAALPAKLHVESMLSSMAEPAGPAFPDRAALTCNSETLFGQKIVFVSSDFTEQEAVRVSQTEKYILRTKHLQSSWQVHGQGLQSQGERR